MATDSKEYMTVIPVLAGTDTATLKWLTRESFDKLAAHEGLRIASFADGVLDPSQLEQYVPRATAMKLPRPLAEYEWHLFTATAVRVEREGPSDQCGYCAPHPQHRTKCGQVTDNGEPCTCPGWPL